MSDNSNNNKRIIEFGLEMLKTIIIGFFVSLMIGIITGTVIETVIFLLLLIPLRQYSGGFHLRSRWACAIVSTMILISIALLIKFIIIPDMIQVLIFLACASVIIVSAPVENENNPLEEDVRHRFRLKALVILGVECIAFLILFLLKLNKYSQLSVMAIALTALLLIAGMISNRLSKQKD